MRKKFQAISTLLIITLLCLIAIASTAYAEKLKDVANKNFIWSVKGRNNTVYLLGSIHVLKKDNYPLPAGIRNIYNCCSKIVFETDLASMDSPEYQQKITRLALYPEGQTLSGNISKNTFTMLSKRISGTGLDIAKFERFRPWFAALTVAGIEFQRLGFNPELGIDRYFFERAVQDRKEISFLETNDYQLNLMAKLHKTKQEMFLQEMLKELDVVESMSSEMINAWLSGDVEGLNSILEISHRDYPDMYQRFFTLRNRNWMPSIEKHLKQTQDVLIIVGAGHLVGSGSVVELLMKKDYTVRQH